MTAPGWGDNPYSYATSDPVNNTDPTGLCIGGLWCPPVKQIAKSACRADAFVKIVCGTVSVGNDAFKPAITVGNGAIQLVKLAGEYTIQFGEGFADWAKDNEDVIKYAVGTVLGAAFAACWAGLVTGPACTAAIAPAVGAYFGWVGGDALASDDQPEGVLTAVGEGLGLTPIGGLARSLLGLLFRLLGDAETVQ